MKQRWRINANNVIVLDFTLLNLLRLVFGIRPPGALAELRQRAERKDLTSGRH